MFYVRTEGVCSHVDVCWDLRVPAWRTVVGSENPGMYVCVHVHTSINVLVDRTCCTRKFSLVYVLQST